MTSDKSLVNALARLIKAKNGHGLNDNDSDYIIVRPKVTGIVYILSAEFVDNMFYTGSFRWSEPDADDILSYKVFRKDMGDDYKMGVFFESANMPDIFIFNTPMAYFLQADKFYALPIADMSYNEAKIEVVATVRGDDAV